MYNFGERSTRVLNELHPDLQAICLECIEMFDFSLYEGHRSLTRQHQLYKQGKSFIDGVTRKGKHNHKPSLAVDGAPYPIDFGNQLKARARFYLWAGYMFACAKRLKDAGAISHDLRWGGDWDRDKDFADQSFDDLPHFELVGPDKPASK